MKIFTLTFVFTLFLSFIGLSQESEINFLDIKLDSAYNLAKSENKLVFVDCFTTWCGPCKYMDANVFTNDSVADYFNDNFINVKLDMEKGEGEVFAGRYQVRSYPTYIFLDASKSRKSLAHRTVGTSNVQQFLQFGMDASDPNVRIGESIKQYEKGNRDPEFIRSYIFDSYKAGFRTEASNIAYWYYQNVNWENLDSLEAKILLFLVRGDEHPYYKKMMKNLSSIEKVSNDNFLYSFLFSSFYSKVRSVVKSDSPSKMYKELMDEISSLDYSNKEKLRSEIQLYYYEQTDSKKYIELAPGIIQKHFSENSNYLNDVAWNIYEKTANKKHLKQALSFVNESVILDENYGNLDTQMRLLYVLGEKSEALKLADTITKLIDGTSALINVKDGHAELVAAMKEGKNIKELN